MSCNCFGGGISSADRKLSSLRQYSGIDGENLMFSLILLIVVEDRMDDEFLYNDILLLLYVAILRFYSIADFSCFSFIRNQRKF